MVVIYGKVELHLPYSQSLKEKRQVVKSISDRVRKRFNISIAEVAGHNLWQASTLGFSAVAKSYAETERFVQALKETLDLHDEEAHVIDFEYDYVGPQP
ncbi:MULTISPECIES: DUF503 domain-containing protein [Syntrophothermus]|uniref:DUF503 domain-containing protein n=1 Tax=Syntrophothermus lipocalidus (strain DSM 12680 / TGB-C1) TaxID=643648 RepID=D7CMF0_SYNLT|nr:MULTISPECIES: DUF503 domain-containing protein [Syntrophothermus]ADI01885.1 protein of unknown function DUF503 [Syntrophothermus lipocalidus DSM 12680]NSW83008.1 DUF503 domain-containing protein [Syntrophothermus sp.]